MHTLNKRVHRSRRPWKRERYCVPGNDEDSTLYLTFILLPQFNLFHQTNRIWRTQGDGHGIGDYQRLGNTILPS